MSQLVKNLPAIKETRVQPLDQEDPLKKEMATHSSHLDWKISWTEEPGGATVHGIAKVGCNLATKQLPQPEFQTQIALQTSAELPKLQACSQL